MSLQRFIVQKVVLGVVGIACLITVVPFFLAIIESLAYAPTVSESSLLKDYGKKLFEKRV